MTFLRPDSRNWPLFAAIFLSFLSGLAAAAPSPDYREATVVLYNKEVSASRRLAEFYAKARRIPAGNLVGLGAGVGLGVGVGAVTPSKFCKTTVPGFGTPRRMMKATVP